MRLVTASEMREMDNLTINKIGVPGIVLMEHAARGASRIFLDHFNPSSSSRMVILCGKGNNGGDGLAMARHLTLSGLKVTVILLARESDISGDALTNLTIIKRMGGINIIEASTSSDFVNCRPYIEGCDYIIDGIFGTGLKSDVKGIYKEAIQAINSSKKHVMSIDIPSGLNSDNGRVMVEAVRADLTVTFGFPKLGQMIFPGAGLVGHLICVDIGIPESVAVMVEPKCHMSEPGDFNYLLRESARDIHKGDRGHLLVLAGSTGKTGAAAMTALGALRAGAGLVTLGIPEGLNNILEVKLTEAMTAPLPETKEGSLSLEAKDHIFRLAQGKSAIAIGPGLSTNPETILLIREIITACDLPMVIDADGLNALAEAPGILEKLDRKKILTPHPGEMGRLMGVQGHDIQIDRTGAAIRFIEKYKCCLVLKGARTIITESADRIYLNPTGNPALSSGGSGDILTGIISGLLARGMPVIKATTAGVYLHGLAGDIMAEKMGEAGVLAGDLLEVIPGIMESLRTGQRPLKKTAPLLDYYSLP